VTLLNFFNFYIEQNNNKKTTTTKGCEKLPLEYLRWQDPAAIVLLFISSIGILVSSFVSHVFIKFSNTCIVKATTRELSYIILAGSYFCYLMTVPLILKPSAVTCFLYRVMPGFSLSLMYGALITKTNRIARILADSKKIITKKPRFMSLTAQVVITCIIISTECILIVAAFIMEPGDVVITYPQRNKARLHCFNSRLSVLGPLGYNMFLVGLCTLYAVRTRNIPENFNEAKFIGFSMYTTCVIWLAFLTLYFGSDFKVITLCLCTSFSATVIIIFLFIPKVYIILFKPEKNRRSAFTTSKDIRCHFGPSNRESSSAEERYL
jgi:metabotropic glutamate receptor 5